jgi:hypothetical protein
MIISIFCNYCSAKGLISITIINWDMKRIIAIACCSILFSSFQKQAGQLQISFRNSTNEDFKKLSVYTSDGYLTFHDLKKGQTTSPTFITGSYLYTYAYAVTTKDTLVTLGYCRTGERNYTKGRMLMEFSNADPKNDYDGKRHLLIKSTIDSTSLIASSKKHQY